MKTYFGYFEHSMIVFNVYLHAKNKLQNSLLSYNITFWIILQFDWPAAFWPITWGPKLCRICLWNMNDNISFPYRLFPRKTNLTKFFNNSQKPYLGPILGPFAQFGAKNEFSWKKELSQFFNIQITYHCAKNQKNLMTIPEKTIGGTHQKPVYFINFFLRYIQSILESCNWLKNPAIWLAKSISDHISETRIFPNMKFLIKYKRIAVIQTFIIDHTDIKNKELRKNRTFLYIQRTLGLAYFPHFGRKIFFRKNLAVIDSTTWVPKTMLSSWEKLKSQFHENFWTEGRTDLIHMNLLAMAKSPIRFQSIDWYCCR